MEQKEILRVVILPLLISLVVFGSNNIIPSVKASKKVRLISPTPYLFPELSISGHLFNFLPSFTTQEELSSSKPKRLENHRISKNGNDASRLPNNKATFVSSNDANQSPERMQTNSQIALKIKDTDTKRYDTLKPTKPFTSNQTKLPTVTNDKQDVNTQEKTTKRHHHFIGHHIGGVGGVFPPVSKESHKHHSEKHGSMLNHKNKNLLNISEVMKLIHTNSTCVHENITYQAGQMIKLNHKSNPCDKCRCEEHEGGGVINCFWEQCEGLPAYDCVPLFIPGACCPIYTCDTDNDVDIEI